MNFITKLFNKDVARAGRDAQELDEVRNKAVSDSGDKLAFLKAVSAELTKLTSNPRLFSDPDTAIKNIDAVIERIKSDRRLAHESL